MRWQEKPYYSLNHYLKTTYGSKLYKISLNSGLTCPNRDGTLGTRGCIFCSEGGSGDFAGNSQASISVQIETGKALIKNKTDMSGYIAYFQAFTNTYGELSYLRSIFFEAAEHPDIRIISIATRPDCLTPEIYDLLAELNAVKPVWIELGLQTIHADTAAYIRRSYPLSDYEKALEKLHHHNIQVITHLILGLPGEDKTRILASIAYLNQIKTDGIKLQLLHILKHTDLAKIYEANPFPVYTMDEYTDLITECIAQLDPTIVIHRITGDGPKNLLIAPAWSGNKRLVLNTIHKKMKERNLWQGKYI